MKQIIIDTNILARLFITDSAEQQDMAKRIMKDVEEGKTQGLISILVIDELLWLYGQYYSLRKESYIPEILNILSIKQIKVIEVEKDIVIDILKTIQRRNIDFTDLYLASIAKGRQIASFDKDFKKLSR